VGQQRAIYDPYEAGLGMFVKPDKGDFVGRDAIKVLRDEGPARRLATFVVDADDADVIGDEPIWHDGQVVGWVTSGGYAHYVDASLAQGYVPAGLANGGEGAFEIEIIGERRAAKIQHEPLFDPEGLRMRG
jgi:dimethylglycine dehydrogenase